MATINAVILKHQMKRDGTWNVKVCVNHRSTPRYIETNNFVSKEMLDSKGKLKKAYIDKFLAKQLTEYRDRISLLGKKVDFMTSSDLRTYLLSSDNSNKQIDVLENFNARVESLHAAGRYSSAKCVEVVCGHLKNFSKMEKISAILVNSSFLMGFESYLLNNIKLSPGSVRTYMAVFSKEFNLLRKNYNNPAIESFPIPFNPFDYYTPIKKSVPKRRNLDLQRIISISRFKSESYPEQLTVDIFMLSFFLCGMNPKDIYVYLTDPQKIGFLQYSRSKIKARRKDGGVTNVKIPEEAQVLIEKYAGVIQKRYSSLVIFHKTFYRSWKKINEVLGFKCTMYYARHSFANIARTVCKFSKDDVSFALNHKYGNDITDVYIEPDWSVVHKVQMGVIEEFRKGVID